MGNTYTQLHIHTVFTVQNRLCLISNEWKNELLKYISGIIQNHEHKVLAINCMPDHVHTLFGMRPNQALSELMKDIKGDSSKWINENNLVSGKFSWQEGYGGFAYSKSHVASVIRYIQNQEKHHKRKSFIEEYLEFLNKFDICYDEKYIFNPVQY